MSHQPEEVKASVGFTGEAGKLGGRPRRPREIEMIQEVADEMKAEMRAVLEKGLLAERAVVVGNTKDAYVEYVPDYDQRLKTLKEMLDRLHGKAKQQTELSGPDDGPVMVASAFDLSKLSVGEKRDLLELLEKTGG